MAEIPSMEVDSLVTPLDVVFFEILVAGIITSERAIWNTDPLVQANGWEVDTFDARHVMVDCAMLLAVVFTIPFWGVL